MPYHFQADRMYRMPTHFGPRTGPRQGPDGRKFDNINSPRTTRISLSFLSDPVQLQALLPPGFALDSEPVVTISASYMTEIEWLAGRGYNTLGVSFPARFRGQQDDVSGSFLTVLWENLADPIITGREELGFAKIYCELPPPTVLNGNYRLTASWMGFQFLELEAADLRQQSDAEIRALTQNQTGDGILHYKYMPRTGEWGTADIAYATLTPAAAPNQTIQEWRLGTGEARWQPARWEDMPTQYNIVNRLAELEMREVRGASLVRTVGGKDLSDQRILR